MKNNYEQAFPSDYTGNSDRDPGISKRFYAACVAMQGLLANPRITELFEKANTKIDQEREAMVKASYQIADELLKQEEL